MIVNEQRSLDARGNLYPNLNRMLELAASRGQRLVHLVQDDSQFVWRSPSLVSDVLATLDADRSVAQVGTLFWKRATKAQGALSGDPPADCGPKRQPAS